MEELLYFEVPQFKNEELGRNRYFFRKTTPDSRITSHPRQIAYRATRIWSLKDGKVKYIKNRYLAAVDEKEFLFIRMAAMPLETQAN